MLIPKVLFLGLASSVGIGSLVPLSSIATGDDLAAWRVNLQTSFPLFTCSFAGSKISISLKLKENIGQFGDGQQIEFWGEGQIRQEQINLVNLSSTASTGSKVYKLTIFETSGSSKLEVETDNSGIFRETLYCKPEVFQVTRKTTTLGASPAWVNGFKDIQLTLGDCVDNNWRKQCSIKIGEGVGLNWKDGFNPRVILNK